MFDLRVWPGLEGSEMTPGKAPDRGKEQMQRLAKLAKKHRNGHMPKVTATCLLVLVGISCLLLDPSIHPSSKSIPWSSAFLIQLVPATLRKLSLHLVGARVLIIVINKYWAIPN